MDCDVAVVGGGPAGSTLGAFLKLYNPALNVAIFERETFPREHVGESQLPTISYYLNELGIWDRVEAAGFPIKVGATYRWGRSPELWDFDFVPDEFEAKPRPDRFEGQRRLTAFQVDRAIYDKILLDHAAERGCHVRESCRVSKVTTKDDSILQLELATGECVTARHYVDATGSAGVLRRALNVPTEYPTLLQNIAIWNYWENAEWAETVGNGGTRVQVLSVGYGWIWYVPISATRTSIGLVVPAEYYKNCRKRTEYLYREALNSDGRIQRLIRDATPEPRLRSTKDWSFVAKRLQGPNWFLVGESAGFADPILSAGMTITQAAAREAAFTILELDRGVFDASWLKTEYERIQVNRFRNHIRFADYWYSANAQFTDLKEHTQTIARDNGLDLSPDKAWQWLASGGFIDDDLVMGAATLSLTAIQALGEYLTPLETELPLEKANIFWSDLAGAIKVERPRYDKGRVMRYEALERGGKIWPMVGVYKVIFDILSRKRTVPAFQKELALYADANREDPDFQRWVLARIRVTLEALILGGWVRTEFDPNLPLMPDAPLGALLKWKEVEKVTRHP